MRESFDTRAEADDRTAALAMVHDASRGRRDPNITAGQCYRLYVSWLADNGRAPTYITRMEMSGRALFPMLDRPVERITRLHLDQYVAARKRQGVSHNTVLKDYRCLHAALAWAVTRDLIARNPIQRAGMTATKAQVPEIPTPEQLQAISDALDVDARRFMWLALATGARLSELIGLRAGDVRRGADGGLVIHFVAGTKFDRPRRCPVPCPLPWRMEPGGHVLTRRGRPWKKMCIEQRIESACGIAGVHRITPHTLRHAHATYSLAHGANVYEVMSRCGWRSFSAMQRYVTLAIDAPKNGKWMPEYNEKLTPHPDRNTINKGRETV